MAPASTDSVPGAYEAHCAYAAPTVTEARPSLVKSTEEPSSYETVSVTAELVGIEIGATAAESVGSVRRGAAIVSVSATGLGMLTRIGGKPDASDRLLQLGSAQPTSTRSLPHSYGAPDGTVTVEPEATTLSEAEASTSSWAAGIR